MGFDAQHRRVVSPMDRADLLALGRERYLPVYRPRELILERGQGARLWDSDGRDYVDFGAGIAVCSLGHCDPELVAALQEQAGKLWHTSNVFYSEPPLRLRSRSTRRATSRCQAASATPASTIWKR